MFLPETKQYIVAKDNLQVLTSYRSQWSIKISSYWMNSDMITDMIIQIHPVHKLKETNSCFSHRNIIQ